MLAPESLARTYDPPKYADPAEQLADYQRVLAYQARNPDHGRTRIGQRFELPPSRVRGWINGGMPDAVRGVKTARDHGWLDATLDSHMGDGFAILAVATYACGGINSNHWPAWNPAHPAIATLVRHALVVLGVGSTTRHAEDAGRPTEIIPGANAAVLGRVLRALGVPRDFSHIASLPDWIFECARGTRQAGGLVFACERTVAHDHSDVLIVQMRQRGPEYRAGVARLMRTLTDEEIRIGETTISIMPAARTQLPL